MRGNAPRCEAAEGVIVWDRPTRLFHWLTVVLVLAAYVTSRFNWMDLHALAGEALLALLLFRLSWGVVGSETARFTSFLSSPQTAIRHLAGVVRCNPGEQVGHNPAGGWMVMLFLALLLGEVFTGIVVNNDVANEGLLTEVVPPRLLNTITDLHSLLWNALAVAVALHIVAITIYAADGHDLLRPMLTGRKRLPQHSTPPQLASSILAVAVFGLSAIAAALFAGFL
jgi:cytochrome b